MYKEVPSSFLDSLQLVDRMISKIAPRIWDGVEASMSSTTYCNVNLREKRSEMGTAIIEHLNQGVKSCVQ